MRLFSKNLLMSKPSEQYEVLESLVVDTNCYVDLGIVDMPDYNTEAAIVFETDATTTGQPYYILYGSSSRGTNFSVMSYLPNYKCFGFQVNKKSWITAMLDSCLKKNTIAMKRTSETSTYVSVRGGVNLGNTLTGTFVPASENLYLFAKTDTKSCIKGKFYSFTLTQSDEVLFDLVPAKRNSDGELGLLNRVNNKFYENSGTGSFKRSEENA